MFKVEVKMFKVDLALIENHAKYKDDSSTMCSGLNLNKS